MDLISAESQGNSLSIMIGNGNGTFRNRTTVSTGAYPFALSALDLNGDGVIDLVSGDYNASTLSVLLGNGTTTYSTAQVSISTQSNAQDMLQVFSDALAYLNSARASIGALQSRLDFATSVNQNTIENISAARSQIMDTDMAAETAEFARLQILQRAGIAVLGQANLNSNLSLKLLEGL